MNRLNLDENKIRLRMVDIFADMESTKPFANDIAFHLTDWVSDIGDLINTYSNIDNLSDDEITSFIYRFLAHVPNHLNAAKKLSGMGKVTDVFEAGIFEDDD